MMATISTMNRSYQEKLSEYGDIESFFSGHFKDAGICILSSHAHSSSEAEIKAMIRELRLRAYNVAAVFFSNAYTNNAMQISLLN